MRSQPVGIGRMDVRLKENFPGELAGTAPLMRGVNAGMTPIFGAGNKPEGRERPATQSAPRGLEKVTFVLPEARAVAIWFWSSIVFTICTLPSDRHKLPLRT